MKDWLRNLLSIRQKRAAPPVGSLPKVGGSIVLHGRLKMSVTHAMPRELWEWMVLSGWRNIPVAEDRRRTRELPIETFKEFMTAGAVERNALHERFVRLARQEATASS